MSNQQPGFETRSKVTKWRIALGVVVATLAFATAACSSDSSSSAGSESTTSTSLSTTTTAPANAAGGEVVREILGRYPAPESPGYELVLMRVTVPAGAELAAHHHPGFEVARVDEGALTYTILEGTASIGRGGSEEPTEQVAAPAEVVLEVGDTVYEPHDMHHQAANRGDVPVVIFLASLIEIGQPIAIAD